MMDNHQMALLRVACFYAYTRQNENPGSDEWIHDSIGPGVSPRDENRVRIKGSMEILEPGSSGGIDGVEIDRMYMGVRKMTTDAKETYRLGVVESLRKIEKGLNPEPDPGEHKDGRLGIVFIREWLTNLEDMVEGYRIRCRGIPGGELETRDQSDAFSLELGRKARES